jgi:hypothetical protein
MKEDTQMTITTRQKTILAAYDAAVLKHGADIEPGVMLAAIQAAVPDANQWEIVATLRRSAEQDFREADRLEDAGNRT